MCSRGVHSAAGAISAVPIVPGSAAPLVTAAAAAAGTSGLQVKQSKFFADSPTKATAEKKRKEQETAEVIASDDDDFKTSKKDIKAPKIKKIDDLSALANDGDVKKQKKARALPAWAKDEKDAKPGAFAKAATDTLNREAAQVRVG